MFQALRPLAAPGFFGFTAMIIGLLVSLFPGGLLRFTKQTLGICVPKALGNRGAAGKFLLPWMMRSVY